MADTYFAGIGTQMCFRINRVRDGMTAIDLTTVAGLS